jgi:hypothetical protein
MTVKELIAKLQQVEDQDMDVVIKGTDPTDWIYYNGVEDIIVEKNTYIDVSGECEEVIILDDEDVEGDNIEDYDEYQIKPLCIIDAGSF